MKHSLPIGVAVFVLIGLGLANPSEGDWRSPSDGRAGALEFRRQTRRGAYPWHGPYYNVAWGTPVALVVPPTARAHVDWGWGVPSTRVTPIYTQFDRDWPGPASYDPRMFRPTPHWPSDTQQFGYYHVRGPW